MGQRPRWNKGWRREHIRVELNIYNDESKPENVSRFFEKLISARATCSSDDLCAGYVVGPVGFEPMANRSLSLL
jgi:hypothetical protein